jgi:hypothetical protein
MASTPSSELAPWRWIPASAARRSLSQRSHSCCGQALAAVGGPLQCPGPSSRDCCSAATSSRCAVHSSGSARLRNAHTDRLPLFLVGIPTLGPGCLQTQKKATETRTGSAASTARATASPGTKAARASAAVAAAPATSTGSSSTSASTTRPRLAYADVLADERGPTAAAFLKRAVA